MKEIEKLGNDELKREYINIVMRHKLENDISEERNERKKVLYCELKKRHLLAKTIKKIQDMNL